MKLIPYVLTTSRNLPFLDTDWPSDGTDQKIDVRDVNDPRNRTFCNLINLANQDAFGGAGNMGMPLWVMLDCAILPSGMIGFQVHSSELTPDQRKRLHVDDHYDGFVPVSEYSASPSVEPDTVCGFSLQAQLPGHNLGVRTKALALAVFKAKRQIGVTQFTNSAIRVHTKLGNLLLTTHRPIVHTHADNSFVYVLNVPPTDALLAIASGKKGAIESEVPVGERLLFDPSSEDDHQRIATALVENRDVWITAPGWRNENGRCTVDMVLGSDTTNV